METERLYLRERTKQLMDNLLTLPTMDQLNLLGLTSIEQLQLELDRSRKRFGNNEEVKWIKWDLIEKNTRMVVGSCSFHNWYAAHERAELGYALNESFQGKGFMLEALISVVGYGFGEMKLNRIEALISPSNMKSIKLIEKLGFTKEGVLREHYKSDSGLDDSVIYSLLRSEYTDRGLIP